MGTKNNPGRFDCYQAAAPDEPMFILLARDPFAVPLVELWAAARLKRMPDMAAAFSTLALFAEAREAKPHDGEKAREAGGCAASMQIWAGRADRGAAVDRDPPPDDAVKAIARICHEANRAYCLAIGDGTQLHWDEAADWQRASAIEGVKFRMANPSAPDSATHDAWLKQHPCCVPFDQLPPELLSRGVLHRPVTPAVRLLVQQRKDRLFAAIVAAFG